MKKCWFFVCVPVILILLVSSCSLGLDPAKSGATEVSFSVGESPSGRLIAPGTGYLYIRTVGGPTGDNGPFYGPFQLSAGSVFTTTEIPAGSYDGFGILYATEPLGGLSSIYLSQEYNDMTFNDFMNLPDDDFIVFAMEDYFYAYSPDQTAFDILIDGRASAEMLENVRIVAGQRNVIAAKLMPVIGVESYYDLAGSYFFDSFPITGNEPAQTRHFFEIHGIPPGSWSSFNIYYTINGYTVFMGSIFIYDQNGNMLAGDIVNSTGPEYYAGSISVPMSGETSIYGYVEFIGDDIAFNGTLY